MDPAVSFITVSTADLDAARRFYVDGLGWAPRLDVPNEIIFFQVAPWVILGLYDAQRFAADLSADTPAVPAPTGVTLAINVDSDDEVIALINRVTTLGATVIKPPQKAAEFNGFHAHFSDPNGLIWEVAHNPSLYTTPDGTIHFA